MKGKGILGCLQHSSFVGSAWSPRFPTISRSLPVTQVLAESHSPPLWVQDCILLLDLNTRGLKKSLSSADTMQNDFSITRTVVWRTLACVLSLWVCAFRAKNVNQMEMNHCSWLVLIKASSTSRRCGCTLCPRQAGRQTVALTHTELSDEVNGTELRISLGTRWAAPILLQASHAVCVTLKGIIHFHVPPLKFSAHRSVVNFTNTNSEMNLTQKPVLGKFTKFFFNIVYITS